ncbi:hypothetical protein ACN27E_22985 [Mycobacterium sp. WMMD1722]|uniref:hypothetical protein n=1 Tax=Mycobacterium sp. WMMD1722 TaxID=3404117 RepID=UPI003BF52B84
MGVQIRPAAIVSGLGVAATLALTGAPGAGADPAPSSVESDYLNLLAANGAHIAGQDADELKLGYLLCALSQTNGVPPAGAAVYMTAARNSRLCYYVSANGGPTAAQIQQGLEVWQQQQNAPGIGAWLDVDPDNDGRPNSEDNFDYDPGHY